MLIKKINILRESNFPWIILVLLVGTQISLVKNAKASTPSESHSANAMWIEPSTVTATNLGDEFNVTIWLNISQTSFAWQMKLFYNSTWFHATRIGYTNGIKSAFFAEHSPMPVTPIVNNEEGYILHGETLLGNDEKIPGCGSLIWIEFNLTEIPSQNIFSLNFSKPYGIDTFVLSPFLDIIPIENVIDGDISMVAPPPILLYISLLILVVIVVATTLIIVVMYRRRRVKKDE
ncbi:MAG: hypothetical protein ACFE95_22665 [Candidatus Hodarchaeota archaeon]